MDWRFNLNVIAEQIENMGKPIETDHPCEVPTLFIRGEKSNYYAPGDEDRIRTIFPHAEIVTMDTGHWVQAEKPEEFARVVLSYLAR